MSPIGARREAIEVDDPSSDHHLFWTEPPETVLVVKKIRDGDVTEKFKVIVKFLVEVSPTLCCYFISVPGEFPASLPYFLTPA